MQKLYLVLFIIFWAVVPEPAHASFISIEIESSVEFVQHNLRVAVKVTNKGDEFAENVKTCVEAGDRKSFGRNHRALAPNEQFTEVLSNEVSFGKPGRYPVVISVDYTDTNQYPFNALTINYAESPEVPNARVTGSIGSLNLYGSDRLNVSVKNVDDTARKVSVRLVASKEFAVQNRVQEVRLLPGDEKKLEFGIKNNGGLSGSTYPVFALISYEDDAYRYLNVCSGSIAVVKKSIWHKAKLPLAILLAVLLCVICFLYLKSILAQRRGHES